jgi:hypothetical protein
MAIPQQSRGVEMHESETGAETSLGPFAAQ